MIMFQSVMERTEDHFSRIIFPTSKFSYIPTDAGAVGAIQIIVS